MRRIERESRGEMRPGQDLVVAGYAGLAGTRKIIEKKEEELRTRYAKSYLEDAKRVPEKELDPEDPVWKSLGATEWEAAGEGGIHQALWNLSGAYQKGFEIDLHQIPVRQETIEVCEFYDLSPYDLLCGNCMVFVADNGAHLVKELEKLDIPARTIGMVQKGIKREICYGQVRGFMDRPKKDEIYEIIDEEAVL